MLTNASVEGKVFCLKILMLLLLIVGSFIACPHNK